MKWVGLTGGIATGKSTVKTLIEGLGVPVIDADAIARLVVEPGHEGYNAVVSHFGTDILLNNKSLNRTKLGEIIFHDDEKRILLESLLHPLIQQEVRFQRSEFEKKGHELCVYDVPLLFEKNLKAQFFKTILVWCDEKTQIERLVNRNKLTTEQALSRIRAQLPMMDKLPHADFCLDNSTTINGLKIQVESLIERLKKS